MRRKDDIESSRDDNVIYVEASEEAAENNARIQREVKRKKQLVWFATLIFVAIIIGGIYIAVNKEYRGYKVTSSNVIDYENSANYVKFCDNLLKYTPDGASYINSNGATVWSAGINMSSPIVEVSGNYAVLADLGGNTVTVFNEEGQVTNVTMPYIICDVDIGLQGAFAVVLESEKTNYINMYNKKGEIIFEMQTTINKSGYPLDITISDDAKKLFTSYLSVGANTVENSLAAYNFGEVGQNSNADRLVGGYTLDEEIVSKVEFLENDLVVAFGTKTITIYSMKEKPSEEEKIKINSDMLSIFYCEDYFGYVEASGNQEETLTYKVRAFNKKGKELFTKNIDFKYNNIYATNKELIITGENRCAIIRKNGATKFNGILSGNIKSVVASGKTNEYIVVYDNKTEKIKLKTGRIDNEGQDSVNEAGDTVQKENEQSSNATTSSSTETTEPNDGSENKTQTTEPDDGSENKTQTTEANDISENTTNTSMACFR